MKHKLTWEKLGTLAVFLIKGCPRAWRSSLTATLCLKRSRVNMLSTALTPRVYFSKIIQENYDRSSLVNK